MRPYQFRLAMRTVNAGGVLDAGGGRTGITIHLTEEEAAAVTRLAALGFDKADALDSYFEYGTNEELAANVLLNSKGEGIQACAQATPTEADNPEDRCLL